MDLKSALKIDDSYSLKITARRTKGSMGETEIFKYGVLDGKGKRIGIVIHTERINLRTLKTSDTGIYENLNGEVLLETSW
ncbi:TPA: hypothetical protein ACGG77_000874 [Vibrio cholerae]